MKGECNFADSEDMQVDLAKQGPDALQLFNIEETVKIYKGFRKTTNII